VYVNLEVSQRVAVVTLDRPEVKNALTGEMVDELRDMLRSIAENAAVRGLVLTGNGAFCAGADLRRLVSAVATTDADRRSFIESGAQALVRELIELPIPTTAAVDGPAVGLGFDVALACDRLVVGPHGWCMQGWGRMGLIAGTGGDLMLRLRNSHILWRLLADQPRLGGHEVELWGIGESSGSGPALEVAVEGMQRLTGPGPREEGRRSDRGAQW
jgi:enoyl-CoA hydratase/carnithine racemase